MLNVPDFSRTKGRCSFRTLVRFSAQLREDFFVFVLW
jgi:hypothetical protein